MVVIYHFRVYLSIQKRIILVEDCNEGGDFMIVKDIEAMGGKLYAIRKRCGLTQAQAAEAANLSINTYAEIERGVVNTGVESIMQICRALHVTPNEFLVEDVVQASAREAEILSRLQSCTPQQKETALRILEVYLQSLE